MSREEKVLEVIRRLYTLYPHPKTALEFKNPLQLLIATILSAQATDKVVNTITPALFEKFPTVYDFANASIEDIDSMIRKVNFHNNKAKSIKGAAQMIVEKYGGEVPHAMQDLDDLPGVARKTANVVMSGAFHDAQGITVDTHVTRIATALGLTKEKTAEKIEEDLMKIVPKKYWTDFPHLLILYGREHSPARGAKPGHLLEDLYNN